MLEWLIILVLGGVIIGLWQKLGALEHRLDSMEEFVSTRTIAQLPESEPDPTQVGEPAETDGLTAPKPQVTDPEPEPVALAADNDSLSEVLPEQTVATHASEPPEYDARAPDTPEPWEETKREPRFDFEDIFGRLLPIWAGGLALAIGGIFLVRYSIEAGLLGPEVRVALSFVFGFLLLGLAEAAYRFADRVADERVRQALAGAGIATLYAAFYLAGAMYGLIGPAFAFGGLALVTAAALGLSFRFGLPTAILGLVGGFLTPVMVASEEANVPILAFYLALLTAGLALTAKRLGQGWLSVAALAGGFIWGGLMLFGDIASTGDRIAIGFYLVALGAAIPLLLERESDVPIARVAAGGIAALQLGALVALAGFDMLTWGLYLLLAAALAVLSWRNKALQPANLLVLAIGIILLAVWPAPPTMDFIIVAVALGIVGLGLPLALIWLKRGDFMHMMQLSIGAFAIGAVSLFQFGSADNDMAIPGLAAGLAALSAIAAAGAWRVWRNESTLGKMLALPVAVSALLAFGAAHVVLPDWAEVIGAAVVTLVLIELVRRYHRKSLAGVGWAGAAVVLLTLISTGGFAAEISLATGYSYGTVDTLKAIVRWVAAGLPFIALALVEWRWRAKRLAEVVATLAAYVIAAQLIPAEALAWTLAIGAVTTAWLLLRQGGTWLTLLVLGSFWALPSVAVWASRGAGALASDPMFASSLPALPDTARYVLPLAFASGWAAWRCLAAGRQRLGRTLGIVAGIAGGVMLHIAYKQVFGIETDNGFALLGMAERTIWQGLLIGGGVLLLRFRPSLRIAAIALLIAGLLHFLLFTFLLHNPLWSTQAVGTLPLLNWLLPAYAIACIGVYWLSRQPRGVLADKLRQLGDAVLMVLIGFWALSELRHAFAGSVLTATDMTQTEDLLRSLLGIVLAIAYLLWGSRTGQRNWRIGSLVLMLLAVLKVFLVDMAGLEELLRVASFVALGASLIGIGWFYARLLRTTRADAES